MEVLLQSIVEQQRVLAETINMMVRNGATGAGLATTIVAENVRMNRTMMIDKFTLQFGSEDRDKQRCIELARVEVQVAEPLGVD